jgi:TonB family protein
MACFIATSAIAVEAEQPTSAPVEPAKPTSSKPAAKEKPRAAVNQKSNESSRKAYVRLLMVEIRKHAPRSTEHHGGSVTVAFTVGPSGRVVSHKIKHASDPALAEVAAKTLASIHTPPPPGGSFSAVQEFSFR